MDAMANMMGGLLVCPGCGQAEVFLDEAKVRSGVAQTCWRCGKQVRFPLSLVCGKTRTLLLKDRKLYAHQLYGDYDMATVAATVTANPKNPAQLGLRNESENNWTYIRPDGQQIPVPKGRSAGIVRDAKICFGQLTGEFHEECLSRADGQAE